MDATSSLLNIFKLSRSYAGAGVTTKVVFEDTDQGPRIIGKKAVSERRNGYWRTVSPSTHRVLVGIDWPVIKPFFTKFPELIKALDFHTPLRKMEIELPARAIKL